MRLMRLPEVLRATGLSRSTIWRLERSGAFPKRRTLSPSTVGWLEQEILHWISTRTSGGDQPSPRGVGPS
jgi:predicted DNA-binding transcriptional regulator AlpA